MAEMGDKTQILAMTLPLDLLWGKYSWRWHRFPAQSRFGGIVRNPVGYSDSPDDAAPGCCHLLPGIWPWTLIASDDDEEEEARKG